MRELKNLIWYTRPEWARAHQLSTIINYSVNIPVEQSALLKSCWFKNCRRERVRCARLTHEKNHMMAPSLVYRAPRTRTCWVFPESKFRRSLCCWISLCGKRTNQNRKQSAVDVGRKLRLCVLERAPRRRLFAARLSVRLCCKERD